MAAKNLDVKPDALEAILDTATDGEEAFNMFKEMVEKGGTYGVIFMDCSMEPMNGYESTSLIKNFCKENKIKPPYVVACTGHTEEEFIKLAQTSGMDEVVAKPCKIEELQRVLRERL